MRQTFPCLSPELLDVWVIPLIMNSLKQLSPNFSVDTLLRNIFLTCPRICKLIYLQIICLPIALSYTILIYISRVFFKEVIENKIRSSSIFLQYLSESSSTPWNFQTGWVEDQNPWEGFFKSLLSRANLGTLNQDFWGRDPGKDILKVSLTIPMHTSG